MYAINSHCQWWVSIATWSQPTNYQRRAKQGCLAVASSLQHDAAAPSGGKKRKCTATFTAEDRAATYRKVRCRNWEYCSGECMVSAPWLAISATLVPLCLDACARTRWHLPRRIHQTGGEIRFFVPPEYESGVPRRMPPEYESKDANVIRNSLEYLPTQTLNYAIITGPTV